MPGFDDNVDAVTVLSSRMVCGRSVSAQVKFESSLEQESIESRAQRLQAKQDLLTTDIQLADLKLKLTDLMGLLLTTVLDLDPILAESQETCPLKECVATATASHPKILEARAEVEKAEAAVRLAEVEDLA